MILLLLLTEVMVHCLFIAAFDTIDHDNLVCILENMSNFVVMLLN